MLGEEDVVPGDVLDPQAETGAGGRQGVRAAAIEAVRAASLLCRDVRVSLIPSDATAKADRSPVTVADLGSQALISLALHDDFPGDAIVGEEDASLLRTDPEGPIAAAVLRHVRAVRPEATAETVAEALARCSHPGGPAGRFWTLDPVDGTKGFLRGGQYAVALALIEDGEPVLGLLGCPNLPVDPADPGAGIGCMFVAERGAGAVMISLDGYADDGGEGHGNVTTERPIRVCAPASPAEARWAESVEAGHSDQGDAAHVAQLLGLRLEPLRMDSQAKYVAVARGEAAIYLRLPTSDTYRERIWDHAAGWLIVREAGGEVTDIHGQPFDFGTGRGLERNQGVVASAGGTLHAEVLRAVARALNA
ncbi:MAG: 3'(2'),5'-bisphosphate nucleotidase [Chloroflexota bacterium]|nr:3'(2'),5'-bisphosphate nucleotidase [Chloroflexota bacterium]